ncbi:unnamed protein product [Ectocarpus sp. CCAP 1310/34]|nr:unnamed protein product [Ectocarpus sp. CCAP 1310/34]
MFCEGNPQAWLLGALIDSGCTLASYRVLHTHPDYPVVLPIWSELSKGDLLPPRQVTRQAGGPKKNRGPRQRSRFPGRNDPCQRGRGNVAQDGGGRGGGPAAGGGGGRGGGGNSRPVPVHGMGSVRSHMGYLNVGGSAGERPTGRLWGGARVSALRLARRFRSRPRSGGGGRVMRYAESIPRLHRPVVAQVVRLVAQVV